MEPSEYDTNFMIDLCFKSNPIYPFTLFLERQSCYEAKRGYYYSFSNDALIKLHQDGYSGMIIPWSKVKYESE